jgi:hypothetical protein
VNGCMACGTPLAEGATQCDACGQPVIEINGRSLVTAKTARPARTRSGFSRWRQGVTNLGWPARGAGTMIVAFAGWWVFVAGRVIFADTSTGEFGLWYAVMAIPVTVLSLWRIWRPTRVLGTH